METDRRTFMTGAGAAFTTALFTGNIKGANDRISLGFIGLGMRGGANLDAALLAPQAQVVALCDCYQPAMEKAAATVRAKYGSDARPVRDFREIIADKSIDAVCISTPDHWHAYMTVEACKAGKDVYVEKPACTRLEEGPQMVAAARKYQRVVQGGNMQRTMPTFLKAKEYIDKGVLGEITWCKTWATSLENKDGKGNPPDGKPPAELDWDMWLGPAPKVPFNQNRWGVDGKNFPTFRYFWDYAGGAMTDWGVHYVDPIHQFLGEPLVESVTALGGRVWVKDNMQTADTMSASFQYPKFMLNYELRQSCAVPLLGQTGGTAVMGTEAYVVVTRSGCWLAPSSRASKVAAVEYLAPRRAPGTPSDPFDHWKNFLECVKSRGTPVAEIEWLVRATASCLLANVSMRAKTRVDLDAKTFTVRQAEAIPFTRVDYRAPWKLEV
ncbi:MAG: Gfo/Idh/MocA family oxidoreductase [Bryobacteraceae bacterium]|jgi:predicted dehydrogenase